MTAQGFLFFIYLQKNNTMSTQDPNHVANWMSVEAREWIQWQAMEQGVTAREIIDELIKSFEAQQ